MNVQGHQHHILSHPRGFTRLFYFRLVSTTKVSVVDPVFFGVRAWLFPSESRNDPQMGLYHPNGLGYPLAITCRFRSRSVLPHLRHWPLHCGALGQAAPCGACSWPLCAACEGHRGALGALGRRSAWCRGGTWRTLCGQVVKTPGRRWWWLWWWWWCHFYPRSLADLPVKCYKQFGTPATGEGSWMGWCLKPSRLALKVGRRKNARKTSITRCR